MATAGGPPRCPQLAVAPMYHPQGKLVPLRGEHLPFWAVTARCPSVHPPHPQPEPEAATSFTGLPLSALTWPPR